MPKTKQRVRLWFKHNEERESAYNGLYVRYKRKKWLAKDLFEYLTEQVELLEEQQCVPKTACLFLLEENLYQKGLIEVDKIATEIALPDPFGDNDE